MTSGASSPDLSHLASVVPLVAAWRLDGGLDYLVPPHLQERIEVGSLVRVRLGRRNTRGIVTRLWTAAPERALEPVLAIVVEPALTPPPLDSFVEWLARRYASPRGAAYARMVPPRVRVEVLEPRPPTGGPEPTALLDYEGGRELLDALVSGGGGVWSIQSLPGEDHGRLISELVGAAGGGGRAALVAVPEVRYGSAVLDALAARWPELARVDSAQPDAARARDWLRLARGHGLGAGGRAAVLAPARELGLIVVDEEHHPSFKEDRAPRFDARRAAIERAGLQSAACVLVSPTPSLASVLEVEERRFGLVEPSRAARRAARPVVELVARPRDRLISHELHRSVSDELGAGRRVALLAPHRGFARSLWCASCRRSLRCPRCEAGLAYDRAPGRVRCPRCGLEQGAPDVCPSCGSTELRYLGTGSERLAEQVALAWPRARVRRVDVDVLGAVSTPQGEALHESEPDIYVTTWIGTKPALRPDVSLVGVLDADRLIRRPDWRAAEAAHEALVAMAEWAGPAESAGRLVVQTSEPGHHAIQAVVRADPRFFATRELRLRAELSYPPYSELVKITASGHSSRTLIERATRACSDLGARVLGPIELGPSTRTPGALEILVKCEDATAVAADLRVILAEVPSGSRLRVDVDPR